MMIVEQEKHVPHRLVACKPDEKKLRDRKTDEDEHEHVITAADFVVDEFELYGLGD